MAHLVLLLLLPLFGHTLANAPCHIFVSNSHTNASIPRAEDFTGVIEMWFWAANGTNFTVTFPRTNPVFTYTAAYQTLKTGWIKTTLDWPQGTYWEHMGTISIPYVYYLKDGSWTSKTTVEVGHTETARMVVASSAPMVWIKQKSCDITSLDYKLFLGESGCSGYDSSTMSTSTITTASSIVPTSATPTTAGIVTVPAAAIVVPTSAAASSTDNVCSQKIGNSQGASVTFLVVLLVLVSLTLLVLSVYTYRLRNQLGITGGNVSFQPLKNNGAAKNGTTIPQGNAVHGSQNSLDDVSVPLH